MIQTIKENLQRGVRLLEAISDEEYSDCSTPPYCSSIGNNMRHVLDFFTCIFNGLENKHVDFSVRNRNELAQQETAFGIAYFNDIITKLEALDIATFEDIIIVTDNLGNGNVSINYTLGSTLAQAHSHAIHHFAIVGFIVNQLGLALPEPDFGYNPTTPKKVMADK